MYTDVMSSVGRERRHLTRVVWTKTEYVIHPAKETSVTGRDSGRRACARMTVECKTFKWGGGGKGAGRV